MRSWRATAGTVVTALLLVGCGSGEAETAGDGDPSRGTASGSVERTDRDVPPGSPTVRTSKPGRAQSTDHGHRPPLHELVATLRHAGVTSVGEAEPSHGSDFQILSGMFDHTLVFATGSRVGAGLFDGMREVNRTEHDGTIVRLMRSETGMRVGFHRDGVAWLIGILDDHVNRPGRPLMSLASAVIDAS